ncbi:PREDICTED: ras-related protein Rab-4A [Nipponia nippon]|nr:PREDICTED: ras-related protein Rab-4A [Nipponia nippon]
MSLKKICSKRLKRLQPLAETLASVGRRGDFEEPEADILGLRLGSGTEFSGGTVTGRLCTRENQLCVLTGRKANSKRLRFGTVNTCQKRGTTPPEGGLRAAGRDGSAPSCESGGQLLHRTTTVQPGPRPPGRGTRDVWRRSSDFLFKFLVIGNAGTGKSCLLHQFIEKKFKDDSNHTIGVEFGSKIVNVGGKYVKLQIWDTAGQERFRSVTRSYYRGAAGALLVYDITSRETYNALTNWLTDARMLASQNIVIILCGNKKDLDADREVTFLEASRFAQENELMFLETSALTGENVEEAFVQCARKILNKIESGELDPERMGSGIQYGDAALRQLRSPRRAQAQSAQECGC